MKEKLVAGIKFGISIIAGFGIEILCGSLTNKIIKDEDMNGVKKACVAIGSAVIGGVIANAADNYISEKVDEVAGLVTAVSSAIKEREE